MLERLWKKSPQDLFHDQVSREKYLAAQERAAVFGGACVAWLNEDTANKLRVMNLKPHELSAIYYWKNQMPVILSVNNKTLEPDPPRMSLNAYHQHELPRLWSIASIQWNVAPQFPSQMTFFESSEKHLADVAFLVFPHHVQSADEVQKSLLTSSAVSYRVGMNGRQITQTNSHIHDGRKTEIQYRYQYVGNFQDRSSANYYLYGRMGNASRSDSGNSQKRDWSPVSSPLWGGQGIS